MRSASKTVMVAAAVLFASATAAAAAQQNAQEIIEKSIAALGGRAAHEKIKSRAGTGTIAITTPVGDISGTFELLNAAPNKTRALIKADLSALGAGELVIDQRFDGSTGYVLDSLQGNRAITGSQLENMKYSSFPHPFLNYKELGISVSLAGKENVGGRDAFVLVFDPPSGSDVRTFVDAETFMPLRTVMKAEVPQLGQEIEQTTEFFDHKEVDGVKVPFRIRTSSSIQTITITLTNVTHNGKVDESLFVKPAGR